MLSQRQSDNAIGQKPFVLKDQEEVPEIPSAIVPIIRTTTLYFERATKSFRYLRKMPSRSKYLRSKGYGVDTVALHAVTIRKAVKYREKKVRLTDPYSLRIKFESTTAHLRLSRVYFYISLVSSKGAEVDGWRPSRPASPALNAVPRKPLLAVDDLLRENLV